MAIGFGLRTRIGVGLLIAIALTACVGQPAGRLFRTELPTTDHDPLPVSLVDETGLVLGIAPWDADLTPTVRPVVQADPTDPNALVISWIGGLAERDATLSFRATQSGYALRLDVGLGSGGGTMAALPRGLQILTSIPIPVSSIAVSGLGF
jgi:hypothetical protein